MEIICIVMLLQNGIIIIIDYFDYKYDYKLMVIDNRDGFDLPQISVCTENNVFFDKQKIIHKFSVYEEYSRFENDIDQNFLESFNKCENYHNKKCSFDPDTDCSQLFAEKNYNISRYYIFYESIIVSDFGYQEISNLLINANELFDCSAKVHYKNKSIDTIDNRIDNCFDRYQVSQSIYGNNDFGICYTFFDQNYGIYLKEGDRIDIRIKYQIQQKFFENWYLYETRIA